LSFQLLSELQPHVFVFSSCVCSLIVCRFFKNAEPPMFVLFLLMFAFWWFASFSRVPNFQHSFFFFLRLFFNHLQILQKRQGNYLVICYLLVLQFDYLVNCNLLCSFCFFLYLISSCLHVFQKYCGYLVSF